MRWRVLCSCWMTKHTKNNEARIPESVGTSPVRGSGWLRLSGLCSARGDWRRLKKRIDTSWGSGWQSGMMMRVTSRFISTVLDGDKPASASWPRKHKRTTRRAHWKNAKPNTSDSSLKPFSHDKWTKCVRWPKNNARRDYSSTMVRLPDWPFLPWKRRKKKKKRRRKWWPSRWRCLDRKRKKRRPDDEGEETWSS
ncbi:hypothetical protein RSOL_011660 [Rhizoctonia solani AG-3 Rhs1AP]|uniref:Uncharacterized protein n=1 Tax=Rhizoctonia solani AG-3 Rhs1AP TaxID=1086054 RepID=X8IWJ5_9AGAM|nr:hypothetical protein RSOL_011660 [Rhizoctonia solani AG-3 Rhs1AP]